MNFQALTEFLNSLVSRQGFPGCDCILYKDHEEVYRHTVGYRDADCGIPLSGKELYFLYSCTKPLTVVAGLTLLEKGAFLLTDPLSRYLPEFASVKVNTGSYALPAKEPIRVSHLFSMTSGYDYALTSPYIKEVSRRTNGRCPTEETVSAFSKIPLVSEPGSHWNYGLSLDILALLIAKVSGKSFSAYVQEAIFDRIGMQNSTFRLSDEVKERMAVQYRYDDSTGKYAPTAQVNAYVLGSEYESGGAGLISSVEDYILFVDMLANGGVAKNGARILSCASVELMRKNFLSPEAEKDVNWEDLLGYTYGMGVRVMVDPVRGGSLSPVGEFGWNGVAGSYLLVDPENHLALFYAQHMLNSHPEYLHPRLRNLVYGGL